MAFKVAQLEKKHGKTVHRLHYVVVWSPPDRKFIARHEGYPGIYAMGVTEQDALNELAPKLDAVEALPS